ncbi:GNAT family N-acetyltransferase [Alkalihalobacillus pseudalcaliphilus]|uniref:GNAT family N-acetyltransferase n=1 Tax=Alkalihalobacillus pseudalcaliphilus TaxID=79884 RepID=UPI00064DA5E3|nr:GNAT family N-acetyltransferase [Alkalihalobacillus pseudalcaliphilus]KMK76341.1 GNAT family acetyltransferase [Alkalihalobacillus pseudalcaliphilus]
MEIDVVINMPIENHEVPDLREKIGWGRRDSDYPALFERCNFWAGVRNEEGQLIAFGYICGMGLEHGYLEDIMVSPHYQNRGIGVLLVQALIEEAKQFGLLILTVTFGSGNENFYRVAGFNASSGGELYLS